MKAPDEGKKVIVNDASSNNEKLAETTDISVFEGSEEIVKKHLPEAIDMLRSRNAVFTQLTQQLEEDFIAAQRMSTESPIHNHHHTHSHNNLKTPHMVLEEAKEQVQRMTRCLLQDLDRVTDDISELLICQTSALSSITSDVHFLSSRLQQIQRHHYDESTISEMTLKSTHMQHHSQRPRLSHSQRNSSDQDIRRSKSTATAGVPNQQQHPFVVTLPLSEVIPPDMHLSLLQYQQQQHSVHSHAAGLRQSTSLGFNGGANQTGAQLNVTFA